MNLESRRPETRVNIVIYLDEAPRIGQAHRHSRKEVTGSQKTESREIMFNECDVSGEEG